MCRLQWGEGYHISDKSMYMGFDYTVDQEGLWASFHIRFMLAVIDGICQFCHFKQQAYGDFEHNQTRNHPENVKIVQAWKAVVDSYSTKAGEEKALIITADDDLNATLRYIKAGVTLVRVNPLSGNGACLAEGIETTFKDVHSVIKRIGWMVSI